MTLDELVRALLPDLAAETVREAERRTGFGGLEGDSDPGERDQILARLRELEADPRFDDRERLVHGEIPRLQRHSEALAPVIERCLAHPRFSRLLEAGYGTPRYATPVWRLAYHQDRKAARELEALCELSFGEILATFRQALEASLVLRERVQELREQVRALEELEQRRNLLRRHLRRLEQGRLETARWRLRRHLEANPALVEELLAEGGEPADG